MKICSKKGCDKKGIHKRALRTIYCDKCYRFNCMLKIAKQYNKYVPSLTEIEVLFGKLHNMQCPICNKQMSWHSKYGKMSNVISLQHNYSGNILLICQGCNSGHGNSMLKDEYFNLNNNERFCPDCRKILNKNSFYKSSRNEYAGICKVCDNIRRSINRSRNKEIL